MEPGEVIAGRYEIEQLRASGATTVYRARDTRTGKPVAITVLRGAVAGSDLEALAREADLLADAHPGIAVSADRGVTSLGESYIVQDWIEAITLRDWLSSRRPTLRAIGELGLAVARALAAAHARGVAHRDLEPTKVMLVDGDPSRVRIVDFGLAAIRSGPVRKLTRTGAVVGTVNYLAPEQARGERADAHADVFALGAVLYECLTGREPFRGTTTLATRAKLLALDPRPLAQLVTGVPAALGELVARMLAKPAGERPADAAVLVDALEALGALADRPPLPCRPSLATASSATWVALSAPAGPLLDAPRDTLRAQLEAAVAPSGCRGFLLDDSSAVVTGSDVVALARAALLLAQYWRPVPIALAGGADRDACERSIDSQAVELDAETIRSVFAGDQSVAGVLVESHLSPALESAFVLAGGAGSLRLIASRTM